MIPEIGVLVSAYVGFRALEIFCFPESRYRSRGAYIFAEVMALILFFVALGIGIELLVGGAATLPTK